MTDPVTTAAQRLTEAERKCQDIPRWLPPFLYRRRLDAAMREWKAANLALFDAQVSALSPIFPGDESEG